MIDPSQGADSEAQKIARSMIALPVSETDSNHKGGRVGENKTQSIGSAENNCYSTGPNTVVKSAIN